MKVHVLPQTPGMFGIITFRSGAEEGKVPIFGYIPIEGVE